LDDGTPTQRFRTSATAIAVVIEGQGESRLQDQRIAWKIHDVFTLPRWHWIEHCAQKSPATLFLMTDRALMEHTGYLREEKGEPL
jgi:gentisate 1,2-dioxygenase